MGTGVASGGGCGLFQATLADKAPLSCYTSPQVRRQLLGACTVPFIRALFQKARKRYSRRRGLGVAVVPGSWQMHGQSHAPSGNGGNPFVEVASEAMKGRPFLPASLDGFREKGAFHVPFSGEG